jgi:hypothetical protein
MDAFTSSEGEAMKKRVLLFMLILLFIPAMTMTAYAHPGRTDGNGGHTDQSTGDYHYHHGYPAHDHYDIDGDGYLDCPYLYVPKNSTGYGNGAQAQTGGYDSAVDIDIDKLLEEHRNRPQDFTYSYIVFGFTVVIIILSVILGKATADDLDTKENGYLLSEVAPAFLGLIIYGILFFIMHEHKYPISMRELSGKESVSAIITSLFMASFVWLFTTFIVVSILRVCCKIFHRQNPQMGKVYYWLFMPLGYIFCACAFVLK